MIKSVTVDVLISDLMKPPTRPELMHIVRGTSLSQQQLCTNNLRHASLKRTTRAPPSIRLAT